MWEPNYEQTKQNLNCKNKKNCVFCFFFFKKKNKNKKKHKKTDETKTKQIQKS